MLRSALDDGLTSQTSVLKFIGERFRAKVELPPWTSDEDVARNLLRCTAVCDGILCLIFLSIYRELVLVHLHRNVDKFNMLM